MNTRGIAGQNDAQGITTGIEADCLAFKITEAFVQNTQVGQTR